MATNAVGYSITADCASAPITTDSLLASMRGLMGGMRIFDRQAKMIVSPGFLAKLREDGVYHGYEFKRFGEAPLTFCGFDLIESREQLKSRKLVSRDDFAEYDEKDADWAVPLGFAKWVSVDVDAMLFKKERQFIDRVIGDFNCTHSGNGVI